MLTFNQFHQGDVLNLAPQIGPGTINLILTSPPYFQQRDYGLPPTDWPEITYAPLHGLSPITIPAIKCCLGREKTIEAYVGHMVLVMRSLRPALRDDGVVWMNLGDKRANDSKSGGYSGGRINRTQNGYQAVRNDLPQTGLLPKNLCGVPWRLALALQADGWALRSDVIWHKSNGSPSSVRDRPTDTHEYLFLLSKQPRYWFDNEAIKTPVKQSSLERLGRGLSNDWEPQSEKANRRTVWKMATAQFPGSHFAVMPAEMAELCTVSGCPPQVCAECGIPYERVIKRTGHKNNREPAHVPGNDPTKTDSTGWQPATRPTDWFECRCDCDVPCQPGVVLDPFSGAGTTAAMAIKHNRWWLGFDLSSEFIQLANERINGVQPLLVGIGGGE